MPRNNQLRTYDWLVAINSRECIEANLTDYRPAFEDEENASIILESEDNTLDLLIQKEAFVKLSSDAKTIITTILHCPSEIAEIFSNPKWSKYSLKKIKLYFYCLMLPNKVDRAVEEIRSWLKE